MLVIQTTMLVLKYNEDGVLVTQEGWEGMLKALCDMAGQAR